jgi:hypothetical protein
MKTHEECLHNQRMRYTHGYYCEDCDIFFDNNSETYKRTELPSDIWMVIRNLRIDMRERRENIPEELDKLYSEWNDLEDRRKFLRMPMEKLESLLTKTSKVLSKHDKNFDSASVVLN